MTTLDLTAISIDELNQIHDLADLKSWTTGCTACALRQESYQVTHSSGPFDSPVMLLGMNPGFVEDSTGIPFAGREELAGSRCVSCTHYGTCYDWQTGRGARRPRVARCLGHSPNPVGVADAVPPKQVQAGPFTLNGILTAGQLLDDVLVALGIDRTKLFVTNAALCHTLEGDPKASAISSCSRIRLRTQELLKPKVIIALGRIAIAQYTGKTVTISKIHGVPFLHTQGTTAGPWTTTVVPTYHPAAILRKMLHASGEDLHAQATSAAIIANEKWNLYDDLATAFHTLDAPTLTSLLLPGKGLGPNGKLVTRTRSTLL